MRIDIKKMILLLLVLLFPVSGMSDTIKWEKYDDGMAIAENENKKTMMYFWTDWCTYCKKMEASTFMDADIIQYLNENFITIRVDGDKESATVKEYGVRGYPDNWFLTEDSERISHLPGYLEAEKFLLVLKYIHTDSFKTMPFKDFVESQ